MKLLKFQVTNYRSVECSNEVPVEADVTCLVGKNESGKTAILQAIRRLNSTESDGFDITRDYPRRRLNDYQARHAKAPDTAVRAVFRLDANEIRTVEEAFAPGICRSAEVAVSKDYNNKLSVELELDESKLVQHLLSSPDLDPRAKATGVSTTTLAGLQAALADLPEKSDSVSALLKSAEQLQSKPLTEQVWAKCLKATFPRFMYFDDYSIMRGTASLEQLATTEAAKDPGYLPVLDLLHLAGTGPTELQNETDYEDHKARLEGTANVITDEVFEFWKQNPDLEVEFDVTTRPLQAAKNTIEHVLHVRIKNRRHRVTVPFDERSRGFVWFFSFLARFNRIAKEGKPLVLLLDEPGLSLHASAQGDFLRFIDQRLAPHHQVIYSTHSPFMIDPQKLHRVRTVEDVKSKGTVVEKDALVTDGATAFPMQAALGYSLAQTLFLGPNCLLVEGTSDLVYLEVMSNVVREAGAAGLDNRWVTTPVGGADRLTTFATLLGSNEINVAVLMDFSRGEEQRVVRLLEAHRLKKNNLLRISDFIGGKDADIEDLFDIEDYLRLVAAAYPAVAGLSASELPPGSRATMRVEQLLAARGVSGFSHLKVAKVALAEFARSLPSRTSIERFKAVFERLNAMVGER